MGVQGAARARRHAVRELRHLQRLRAARTRADTGKGGVPQFREIRVQEQGLESAGQYQELYRRDKSHSQSQSCPAADGQLAFRTSRRPGDRRLRQRIGGERQCRGCRGDAREARSARILVSFRRDRDRACRFAASDQSNRKSRHRRASYRRMGWGAPAYRRGTGSRPELSLLGMKNIEAAAIKVDSKLEGDELWFKDAIIYQLHVKAFADSK